MKFNRSLVFTVAVNYDLAQLELFINSILINCPNLDILFFCDKSVKKIILKSYPEHKKRFIFSILDNLTVYKIKKKNFFFKLIFKIITFLTIINNYIVLKNRDKKIDLNNIFLGQYLFINSHFLLRRFIWYLRFINKIKDKYHFLILSDCRDVIFQSDPFLILKDKKKFIVSGYEAELIKNNKFNKNWLLEAYKQNSSIYKNLINSKIICAGVSFGTIDMIVDYLMRMKYEIKNYIISNKKNIVSNLDQCFHNKIFYYAKNEEFIVDNSNELISTIGFKNKFNIKIDKSNKKILVNGNIPCIIHQYDRDKLLSETLYNWFTIT